MEINPYRVAQGLIEQGWIKGALSSVDPSSALSWEGEGPTYYCARGAVWEACARLGLPNTLQVMDGLEEVCVEQYGHPYVGAANDEPERTKAEALALFDKAAVTWEERI